MVAFDKLGWDMKNVVCEGAYSQFELDFGYTDLLGMADRFVFLRVMLKELAKRRGLFVTFMPKPTQADWRNGAHINHSAQALDRPGVNLFEGADGDWSDTAFHALGGLIRHGGALTALACPTVNSYKGLIGRTEGLEGGTLTWAPTHMCYGRNNRSAMFRLPQPRKAIENRAADMCQNVYLSLAMTSAASLEGILGKLPPGPEVRRSLYDVPAAELAASEIKRLPTNLLEAVTLFDQDALAERLLGPTMHGMYSRLKHGEWRRFHEQVTEWERAEYLRFF
jgi:glutamine synthetase